MAKSRGRSARVRDVSQRLFDHVILVVSGMIYSNSSCRLSWVAKILMLWRRRILGWRFPSFNIYLCIPKCRMQVSRSGVVWCAVILNFKVVESRLRGLLGRYISSCTGIILNARVTPVGTDGGEFSFMLSCVLHVTRWLKLKRPDHWGVNFRYVLRKRQESLLRMQQSLLRGLPGCYFSSCTIQNAESRRRGLRGSGFLHVIMHPSCYVVDEFDNATVTPEEILGPQFSFCSI